eukprot:4218636-Amphidinium_carterae.1
MFQSPDGQTRVGSRDVFPAAHKGGATVLTTLNVGCLTNKLEGIADMGSDFVAIQEAGIVHAKAPGFHRLTRALNLQLHFGPSPKSVTDAAGRRSHNKSLGVAMAAKAGLGVGRMDASFRKTFAHGTRLSTFLLARGNWQCLVHVVYFQTGSTQVASQTNEAIMSELLTRVEARNGTPQAIMGDFQAVAYDMYALRHLFQRGWISSAQAGEIQYTNESSKGSQTLTP